jgi:hypothetical protein
MGPELGAQPAQSQPPVLDREERQLPLAAELATGPPRVRVIERGVGTL